MQPVFPYRPQRYPPRGPQWPQFGDDVLADTLSLSEGARQSLNKKREAMSDFHKEILQHHGLAPRFEDVPLPHDEFDDHPDAPREEHEWPDELYTWIRRPGEPEPVDMAATDASDPPQGPPPDYPSRRPFVTQGGAVARYDPPQRPLAAQVVSGGGYNPPPPPGAGAIATQTERPRKPLVAQTGVGGRYDPPNDPGAGAATQTERPRFVTQVGKVTSYHPSDEVEVLGGGGRPPPPPGAGGVLIPAYAAGPEEPLGAEITPHPSGDPYDAAFLQPRVRSSPYARTRITGKASSAAIEDEFFADKMDTAASAPAAIVPMEEQNTGMKRSKEAAPKSKAKAKKKKDEIVATQSPPSLPPPPPGGAAALRATEEPDVEPASASSANAPTSVPHYRQKEGSASSGPRRSGSKQPGLRQPPPDAAVVEPAVPVKRKTEKPLDDGTPAALRPERQRPRAPQAEPDAEPNPLRVGSSSSSSSGPTLPTQSRLL